MSSKTIAGTQTLDIWLDKTDLGLRQELEMDSLENKSSTSELTLMSVDERIKQATDPIFS